MLDRTVHLKILPTVTITKYVVARVIPCWFISVYVASLGLLEMLSAIGLNYVDESNGCMDLQQSPTNPSHPQPQQKNIEIITSTHDAHTNESVRPSVCLSAVLYVHTYTYDLCRRFFKIFIHVAPMEAWDGGLIATFPPMRMQ